MRINFRPNREKGLTLLGLILFIVALIIICGIIIYIITRISRIPPRQLPEESITMTTDPAVVESITGQPAPTVTASKGISASFVTPTAEGDEFTFIPFTVIIERTTNFIHWEGIQTNRVDETTPSGQITTFSDTNVFDRAFYRAHYIYD